MRMMFTGASSALGNRVLQSLLANEELNRLYSEVWCTKYRREISLEHPKLRPVSLDLADPTSVVAGLPPMDLVVHFASLTHSHDESLYWKVNCEGLRQFAKALFERGCRKFVYVSTMCASKEAGAYGASKLAAEEVLRGFAWESLLILRPADVYGAESNEGIERLIALGKSLHVVPMFFGHRGIGFSPLHVDDFLRLVQALVAKLPRGTNVYDVKGPEKISGVALAARLGKKYRALPIPVWWPAFYVGAKVLHALGSRAVAPDQALRLVGKVESSHAAKAVGLEDRLTRFPESPRR